MTEASHAQTRGGADARESKMRALAQELFFTVDKSAAGFTLTRTADLSRPERAENLTLAQAEELLKTWKLRGLGGG
jgi:hypothetical protein